MVMKQMKVTASIKQHSIYLILTELTTKGDNIRIEDPRGIHFRTNQGYGGSIEGIGRGEHFFYSHGGK